MPISRLLQDGGQMCPALGPIEAISRRGPATTGSNHLTGLCTRHLANGPALRHGFSNGGRSNGRQGKGPRGASQDFGPARKNQEAAEAVRKDGLFRVWA
jgi:hypothetical protein